MTVGKNRIKIGQTHSEITNIVKKRRKMHRWKTWFRKIGNCFFIISPCFMLSLFLMFIPISVPHKCSVMPAIPIRLIVSLFFAIPRITVGRYRYWSCSVSQREQCEFPGNSLWIRSLPPVIANERLPNSKEWMTIASTLLDMVSNGIAIIAKATTLQPRIPRSASF